MARRRKRSQSSFWFLLLIALVLLLVISSYREQEWRWPAATGPQIGRPIRIATWNIRKFSDRDGIEYSRIAKIIRDGQVDLLAIQEVQQEGQAVHRLCSELGGEWRCLISQRTGNRERFAFVYRADVLAAQTPGLFMQGTDAPTFDRTPYYATFRAGAFDFTLVTVHLSYTDTNRRRREAEALARFAYDLAAHGSEKDIIVVGDFNEQGRGNLHYFEGNGWTKLNRAATNLSSREVYDNLLIDPHHTREWSGSAGVINFDELMFGNDDRRAGAVSDHRPVWADFATAGPDDD